MQLTMPWLSFQVDLFMTRRTKVDICDIFSIQLDSILLQTYKHILWIMFGVTGVGVLICICSFFLQLYEHLSLYITKLLTCRDQMGETPLLIRDLEVNPFPHKIIFLR